MSGCRGTGKQGDVHDDDMTEPDDEPGVEEWICGNVLNNSVRATSHLFWLVLAAFVAGMAAYAFDPPWWAWVLVAAAAGWGAEKWATSIIDRAVFGAAIDQFEHDRENLP